MKHMVSPETMWGSPLLCLVTQSCPTLCDLMDCSPPGSFVQRSSPGKNTAVSCHALLQGIFLTQGLNPHLLCLLHCRWILYPLSHVGSPYSYDSSPIHYHLLPKSLQLSYNWSSRFCYCSSSLFLLFLKFQSDHINPLHKPFKGPHLIRIKVHVLTTTGHDISLPVPQIHLGCSCLEACSCALIFCLNYFSPKLLSSDLCSNASLTTILIPLTCFILFYTCYIFMVCLSHQNINSMGAEM